MSSLHYQYYTRCGQACFSVSSIGALMPCLTDTRTHPQSLVLHINHLLIFQTVHNNTFSENRINIFEHVLQRMNAFDEFDDFCSKQISLQIAHFDRTRPHAFTSRFLRQLKWALDTQLLNCVLQPCLKIPYTNRYRLVHVICTDC